MATFMDKYNKAGPQDVALYKQPGAQPLVPSPNSYTQSAYPESITSAHQLGISVGKFPVGEIPRGNLPERKNIDTLVHQRAGDTGLASQFSNPHEIVLKRLKDNKGNNDKDSLSNGILDGFRAGVSVMNTMPGSVGLYADSHIIPIGNGPQQYRPSQPKSIADQFSLTRGNPLEDTPKGPMNPTQGRRQVAGPGVPQYGVKGPGEEKLSEGIIRAYKNIREDGKLAGLKADMLPVFDGNNTVNLTVAPIFEQRPTNSHLGRDGLPMPDHMRIDIKEALRQGHDIPTGYIENDAQLAEAFDVMGYDPGDGGLSRAGPYGALETKNKMMSTSSASLPRNFYQGSAAGVPSMYVPNKRLLM